MAKLVDVWIFDWDKYSPDDLVQKDDCFQLGPALLPALAKKSALPLAVLALGCVDRDQDQDAGRNVGQQQCQRCARPPKADICRRVRRTVCDAGAMSALSPKADMCSATRHVRFVPIADIRLFDHLVCELLKTKWHFEAERLGGL